LTTTVQLTITEPHTHSPHVVPQSNAPGPYLHSSPTRRSSDLYAGNGAHDELTAGQQVQDQFTVTSQDGTASGTVTVTITGTNDAARVSTRRNSSPDHDTAAVLCMNNQLTITDPDTGEAHVVVQ